MAQTTTAKVLFDYRAEAEGELTIIKDDILTIKEISSSGWWLAEDSRGVSGWVPSNYLQKNDNTPAAPSAAPVSVSDALSNLKNLSLVSAGEKVCGGCREVITGEYLTAKNTFFHIDHFKCVTCQVSLAGNIFVERDNQFYCERDFHAAFSPKCGKCAEYITGRYITALEKQWHPECFVCTECGQGFENGRFRKHDNRPYCDLHYNELFGVKCHKCQHAISGPIFDALGHKYHPACFTCEVEGHVIDQGSAFHVHGDKVYCPRHFEQLFLHTCSFCSNVINEQYIKVLDQYFHVTCWKCANCEKSLHDGTFEFFENKFVCRECHQSIILQAHARPAAPAPPPKPAPSPAALAAKAAAPALAPPAPARAHRGSISGGSMESKESKDDSKCDLSGPYFEYSMLTHKDKERLPPGVDASKREAYLSDADFTAIFKMSKAEFYSKKAWQQEQLKKKYDLW